MNNSKRILIAGCGDIGTTVGTAMVAQGHHVTGLRRKQMTADATGICYFQADLTQPQDLVDLPTDYDLLLIIVTPSERSLAGYRAIYLEAVANLLEHFNRQAVNIPVIYISSTRVYGQNNGEWVDESSPTEPNDDYGRILLEAEQQVLAVNRYGSVTTQPSNTIVRFSGIYGRSVKYMQDLAAQNKPVQHSPASYTNRIHRDDCVAVLAFLANKLLRGETLACHYLVTDDEPAPKWDVVNWLATQAGLPSPEKQHCEASTSQGKRCCNQRIRAAGYSFRYPSYREGYSV